MLKLCGALMVLGVGVYAGIDSWKRMQMRAQMLANLTASMELLRTEIAFLQTPLPEAADKITQQTKCTLFLAFAKHLQDGDLPETAMYKAAGENSVLHPQDADLLVRIAGGLGCSDADTQKRHIENAIKRLEEQTAQATEVLKNNGRLCVGAGALGGLLLVILLL